MTRYYKHKDEAIVCEVEDPLTYHEQEFNVEQFADEMIQHKHGKGWYCIIECDTDPEGFWSTAAKYLRGDPVAPLSWSTKRRSWLASKPLRKKNRPGRW